MSDKTLTDSDVLEVKEKEVAEISVVAVALEQAGIDLNTFDPATREVLEGLSADEAIVLARVTQRLQDADTEMIDASGGINH